MNSVYQRNLFVKLCVRCSRTANSVGSHRWNTRCQGICGALSVFGRESGKEPERDDRDRTLLTRESTRGRECESISGRSSAPRASTCPTGLPFRPMGASETPASSAGTPRQRRKTRASFAQAGEQFSDAGAPADSGGIRRVARNMHMDQKTWAAAWGESFPGRSPSMETARPAGGAYSRGPGQAGQRFGQGAAIQERVQSTETGQGSNRARAGRRRHKQHRPVTKLHANCEVRRSSLFTRASRGGIFVVQAGTGRRTASQSRVYLKSRFCQGLEPR